MKNSISCFGSFDNDLLIKRKKWPLRFNKFPCLSNILFIQVQQNYYGKKFEDNPVCNSRTKTFF